MEQLLRNGVHVEVRIDKIVNGGFVVRVLSESERAHANMMSLHLSAADEDQKSRELQSYAGLQFLTLPQVSVEEMVNKLVLFIDRSKQFQRGFVEKKRDNNTFLIRNIDTRIVQISIPASDVRLLPGLYGVRTWPPRILQFKLSMVKPVTMPIVSGTLSASTKVDTEKWDRAADDYIKQLTRNKVVVCKITNMNPTNGVYSVTAWSQISAADPTICINEELVKKNFARVEMDEDARASASPSASPRSSASPNIRMSPRASGSPSTRASPSSRLNRESNSISTSNITPPTSELVPTTPRRPRTSVGTPSFDINVYRRTVPVKPLIVGCDSLLPVYNIEECNFFNKIEAQYKRGRGTQHTNLSNVQKYGWPLFSKGRDSVCIFPPDNTLRTELTFLIPILSTIAKGTYARFPRNYSPKVIVVVPSCNDADQLVGYCRESLDESLRYAINVRKAYTLSKYSPHADLWNNQDILVITPDSLVKTHTEHIPSDRPSMYYSNTCHVVLHKAHDLFTHHIEAMRSILHSLHQERIDRDYAHACQLLLLSDLWLPIFHKVTRAFMSEPVVVVQNRTECAIFSGVKTIVEEYNNSTIKLDALITTTKKLADQKKKVAIFISSAGQELTKLVAALRCKAVPCYEMQDTGANIQNWSRGSAMVISDEVGERYQVPDCDVVLHYDLPSSLIYFNNRLSFFEAFFKEISSAETCVSCFFLTKDEEPEKVNNLVKHLRRYGAEIPPALKDKADQGELVRQKKKHDEPLCPYLRQYGSCSVRTCPMRHVVLEQDAPGSNLKLLDIPLKGKVQVKITAVADGNRFFGRLISVNQGKCDNADDMFKTFHKELQTFFTTPRMCDEEKLEKDKKIAVQDKQSGEYFRAKVKAVRYNADLKGGQDAVTAQCIDTGTEGLYPLEKVFKIPHRSAQRPPFAIELIVCGIKPAENDRHFASYCKEKLRCSVIGEVLEGNIELALGNCLWVRTLEKRKLLKNLKLMSSELSVKKVIMDNMFGVSNPEHIKLLKDRVREALPDDVPEDESDVITSHITLDTTTRHVVCVAHVTSPYNFYVNVVGNVSSLQEVEAEINDQKLLDSILPCWLPKNSYCMARYSKDNRWYRGEIRRTWHDKYHVFFVDYGNEDKAVPATFVKAIPPYLLEFPFQAIQCSLSEICVISEEWSSTDQLKFTDLTLDEDMFMDIVLSEQEEEGGGGGKLVVRLYYDDEVPLIDILCRDHVGLNKTHLDSSAFSEHFYKLYRSKDDYSLLCSAEAIEKAICEQNSQTIDSDLATLCRLSKLHLEDDDILVHLLPCLVHILQQHDDLCSSLIAEEILELLIKKLSSYSPTHKVIAHLIAVVGKHQEAIEVIEETCCIVSLCELCIYKEDQAAKLQVVLQAIRTLATKSDAIRKEIQRTGHIGTFSKFLRESSDTCLEEIILLLSELLIKHNNGNKTQVPELDPSFFNSFRDDQGLRDVCRATKRTWSPAVINIIKLFHSEEHLTQMKREGLAEWFKKLKERRRDFGTRLACDSMYKKISAHVPVEDKDNYKDSSWTAPPPMIRVPITTPIDQPVLKDCGQDFEMKQPTLHWHQRKRYIGVSIKLQDVGKHELSVDAGRTLHFMTWNSGVLYQFSEQLFSYVTNFTKEVNRSEVLVTLYKHEPVRWTRLLKHKKSNVKLDFSRACDSEDETDSEAEEEIARPVPCGKDVEVRIGGDTSSGEDYMTEEEEIGDDFSTSIFRRGNVNRDSDDMEALE